MSEPLSPYLIEVILSGTTSLKLTQFPIISNNATTGHKLKDIEMKWLQLLEDELVKMWMTDILDDDDRVVIFHNQVVADWNRPVIADIKDDDLLVDMRVEEHEFVQMLDDMLELKSAQIPGGTKQRAVAMKPTNKKMQNQKNYSSYAKSPITIVTSGNYVTPMAILTLWYL